MRLMTTVNLLRSWLLGKNKLGHVVFYALGAAFIAYAYNFNTLFVLLLLVFLIFACASFLAEIYFAISGRPQTKKDFILALMLVVIATSLCYMFASSELIYYILRLSIITSLLSVYLAR